LHNPTLIKNTRIFYFRVLNVLFKTPNGANIVCVVLIVVVLIAIVEILVPRVVVVVLRRTPIVVIRKTTNHLK